MGHKRRDRVLAMSQANTTEQQWDNMIGRMVERAKGVPTLAGLSADLQEGLILLQRLKDQITAARDLTINELRARAEKAEARVKELEKPTVPDTPKKT